MITNGVVTKNVIDRFCDAGINKINISLHGYNGDVFESVTGGTQKQLRQTLDTIEYLKEKGILGKVNYVLLKGVNEEEFLDVLDYTVKQNIVLDVLNYLGTNAELIEKFYYSFEEITEIIRQRHPVSNVYQYTNDFSLPSTRLMLEKGGTINLKTTKLNTISFLNSCEACDKRDVCVEGIAAIRLTADGIVKPCIFRDDNTFDLLKCIRENGEKQAIEQLKKYLENL
jgi:cyclic pyranopterin phosphate synthase